jgi:hypothetical protein
MNHRALFIQEATRADAARPAVLRALRGYLTGFPAAEEIAQWILDNVVLENLERFLLVGAAGVVRAVRPHALAAAEAAAAIRVQELAAVAGVNGVGWQEIRARMLVWIRQHSSDLVTGTLKGDRAVLRELLEQTIRDNETREQFARRLAEHLRRTIGLDRIRARDLASFAETLRPIVAEGRMTAKNADRLMDIYRRTLLRHRAETIAQTEINVSMNNATHELWSEARARGQLIGYVKVWLAILRDGHACRICYAAHGQRQELNQPFVLSNGKRVRVAHAHVKCRCQMTLEKADESPRYKVPFIVPRRGRSLRPMIPKAA